MAEDILNNLSRERDISFWNAYIYEKEKVFIPSEKISNSNKLGQLIVDAMNQWADIKTNQVNSSLISRVKNLEGHLTDSNVINLALNRENSELQTRCNDYEKGLKDIVSQPPHVGIGIAKSILFTHLNK